MLPWIAGALVLGLFSLTSCVEVEEVDATPVISTPEAFTSPLPATSSERNLAVLAVDFDPPLSYQQLILRRQSIELLVAVENRGSSTERNVTVRGRLSSPEDPELDMSQGVTVGSIAPGEIQVVHFARLGEIPYHQTYHLEVTIDPLEGEKDFDDNAKAFDIQIHPEGQSP
jgi:hypothetical protein